MGFISWLFGAKPKAITKLKEMGLSGWYESSFSNEQRNYIEATLLQTEKRATSEGGMSFGDITIYSDKCQFLTIAARLFGSSFEGREVGRLFLKKAIEIGSPDKVTLHLAYGTLLSMCYRDRERDGFLDQAIEACEGQIEIAREVKDYYIKTSLKPKEKAISILPAATGFKQLAIIREKQKDYEAVIALCRRAQTLKWPGDWDKRIERCKSRLEKAKK